MAAAPHKAELGHDNLDPAHVPGAAPGHALAVEIRSPDGPLWVGTAKSLKVPESLGLMGILPGHAPLIATLESGLTTIRLPDGGEFRLITGDGFLEITRGRVLMLVDFGEDPAKVDLARARESRDRALSRLRAPKEDVDLARAEAALRRALARLRYGEAKGLG
jgi:F-type H+-transporting ATPase subunit epsilon